MKIPIELDIPDNYLITVIPLPSTKCSSLRCANDMSAAFHKEDFGERGFPS